MLSIRRSRTALIAAMLGVSALAACAPAPELIGVDNPEIPVDSVAEATTLPVFLATTRQQTETVGAFFSEARAPELGLASVLVSIPPTHEVGQLERPERLPPDPRTEFAVVEPKVYATDQAFVSAVDGELRKLPAGKREVLLFVHGYNNTTSDAVLRLAQFVHDTNFEGVPVLLDWASAGQLTRYVYDLNSALIARGSIPKISNLMNRTIAEKYTIFAHSMGGFLTMEAILDQSQKGTLDQAGRIESVILASPDIDFDLFKTQLNEIGELPDRFFVLLSKDDGALNFSQKLAGGVPRVGAADIDALAELGVIAIDLSEIDDSSSGNHTKFAGSPEVVQLIGQGLNNTSRFDRRARGRELTDLLIGLPITVAFD